MLARVLFTAVRFDFYIIFSVRVIIRKRLDFDYSVGGIERIYRYIVLLTVVDWITDIILLSVLVELRHLTVRHYSEFLQRIHLLLMIRYCGNCRLFVMKIV